MKDRAPAADAHAYVDNCMTFEERKAFEVRLRQDGELRRRVELWQTQSEAIRSTFGAAARISSRRPDDSRLKFVSPAPQPRREPAELGSGQVEPAPVDPQALPKWAPRQRRIVTFAAFVLIGVTLFPGAMAYPPRSALMDAGAAAFRAFSVSPTAALDFHGVDGKGLSDALGPWFFAAQLPGWVAPPGWQLRGAKRVPGLQGAAVLILLEGADGHPLGVMVEPLDAPASSAIRTESHHEMTTAVFIRRGYGMAVVGKTENGVEAWLSASGFGDQGKPHLI